MGGLVSIVSYSRLSLMIIASRTQFHVGAFNQEKALVGAFSVIVQPVVEPMDHFTALSFMQKTVKDLVSTATPRQLQG